MPFFDWWWPAPWLLLPALMCVAMIVAMVVMASASPSICAGHRPWWRRLGGSEDDEAIEILRRRFASGEIGDQEYEQRRQALLN